MVRAGFRDLAARLAPAAMLLVAGCSDKPTSPSAGAAGASTRLGPPDVLLVTLDTTRADRFGCYGYERPTTPHFDTLAADGVQFDLAISTSGTTPIAHASILSGLNNYQHGVRVILGPSGYRLPDFIPTLATVFKESGWETGAFLSSFPVSEHFGFSRGFDTFDSGVRDSDESKFSEDGKWEVRDNQRRSDETSDAFIAWVKQRRGRFFAWIHYWDAHDPQILPPAEMIRKFPPTEAARVKGRVHPKLASYDAEVAFVDHNFGRVIQTLKETGRYENTVIIVTADHGEGLGDHGWMNHRLLYQEQIRIPLLVHAPGGPKGKRIADLVRNIDIYPTILELAKISPPQPVQGRSMVGLMNGQPDEPRMAYADQLNRWDRNARMTKRRPYDELIYCAMDRNWKLIYRDTAADQSLLYNIAVDPRETNNLYAQRPDQVSRLKGALDEFNGYRRAPFPPGGNDAEALERLKSLGYAGEDEGG